MPAASETWSNPRICEGSILLVPPALAAAIGFHEALMLQQIHYWLGVAGHERDGRHWIYNSYSDWAAQLPFWSRETVRRVLGRLRARGLVLTGDYNRHGYDRTLWYTIDYAALAALGAEHGFAVAPGPDADPPDAAPEGGTPAASGGESAPPGGRSAASCATSAPSSAQPCGNGAPSCGENGTPGGNGVPAPGARDIACGDSGTTIPETTTEITSEINARERERDGAPSPPAFETLTTTTDALTGWWTAGCATAGVPAAGINVRSETDKWRDEIRAGRRPVPADAAADWRQWMRRALAHYRRYPPPGAPPAVPPPVARGVPTVTAEELAAREVAGREAAAARAAATARLTEHLDKLLAERGLPPAQPAPRTEPEVDALTAFRNRAGALFGRAPVAPGEERAPRLEARPPARVTAGGLRPL
jgi:hypothetical protein